MSNKSDDPFKIVELDLLRTKDFALNNIVSNLHTELEIAEN